MISKENQIQSCKQMSMLKLSQENSLESVISLKEAATTCITQRKRAFKSFNDLQRQWTLELQQEVYDLDNAYLELERADAEISRLASELEFYDAAEAFQREDCAGTQVSASLLIKKELQSKLQTLEREIEVERARLATIPDNRLLQEEVARLSKRLRRESGF